MKHLEETGPEVFAHGDVDEGVDDGMDKGQKPENHLNIIMVFVR